MLRKLASSFVVALIHLTADTHPLQTPLIDNAEDLTRTPFKYLRKARCALVLLLLTAMAYSRKSHTSYWLVTPFTSPVRCVRHHVCTILRL